MSIILFLSYLLKMKVSCNKIMNIVIITIKKKACYNILYVYIIIYSNQRSPSQLKKDKYIF